MPQGQGSGQVIWCLGMYASASTWIFNVVRQMLEVAEPERFHAVFVSGKERSVNWGDAGQVTVVKSHEIDTEPRVLEVARRASRILISVRDPRDSVVSLMQAHEYDFSRALTLVEQSAVLCRSFAKDGRTKLFNYETRFFEMVETVGDIALHLGYRLHDGVARSMHDSLSRAEVERYIRSLPKLPGVLKAHQSGDLLDPKTQWHSHHAGRTGEIGKWKRGLTANETDEIMTRLRGHSELFRAE